MAITSLYLPIEGLQGETIPSFITWDEIDFDTINISFRSPLMLEEVYNSNSWEIQGDKLVINNIDWDGYLGLKFKSKKTSDIQDIIPVEYFFKLKNGDVIKETRKIELFKPKLEVEKPDKNVQVNLDSGYVGNRIKIKNTGKGTLLLLLSTPKDASTKLETPFEYREFIERFSSDLKSEFELLEKEFPNYQSILNEYLEWDEKTQDLELSGTEKEEYIKDLEKIGNILANDVKFLQGFAEAYVKALIKNSEFIQYIGRFIQLFESIVSKNILLLNPFDKFKLTKDVNEIELIIKQTDKLFDEYEDITLKFRIQGNKEGQVEAYRIFEWGKER